ncbi:DUF2515 family protein [Virgibacillus kimchii]
MIKWFPSSKLSPELKRIKKKLKKQPGQPLTEVSLNKTEQALVEQIRKETAKHNLNNITRTKAYLDFYQRFPEIHWAFLGHMVSRNGGWNMTDLKGDLISYIMDEDEQDEFFAFLERGNWLIFQDVYPQMLLYEVSIKNQKNLFYLLPIFHVSFFMHVIWNDFLEFKDKHLLTVSLIINEQSYMENRVIQNPEFKDVLDSIEFKLQELLSLNQIVFPYENSTKMKLLGETVSQFSSLEERIELGKRLYKLLYDKETYRKIREWAAEHPHTGSRRDYWPHLYNDINESVPGNPFQRRTRNCTLRPGSHRIFSPQLEYTFTDVDHKEAEQGDWYTDWKIIYHLEKQEQDGNGDILDEYCKKLERIELAILAKETFF